MRLVFIHRYFWPDSPPYASMLRTIATHLQRRGHDVTVLTGRPDRRRACASAESLDGVQVRRLPVASELGPGFGKFVNLLTFPVAVVVRLLTMPRPSFVMCSTAPQVTLGFAVSLAAAARRIPFVYHCMDLHPEIGRLSGEFANPVVYRILARMDRATMRRSAAVVVLSRDMREAVSRRDPGLVDRVVILNNFALPSFEDPGDPPLPAPEPGRLRVVFTGNLGRFQGLEEAVAALHCLPVSAPAELVFMGDGVVLGELRRAAAALPPDGPGRVVFVPRSPVGQARALMRSAHVGLVSLVPGIVDYAYPSKTATYLEEGLPVLAVCEPGSELAETVRNRGLGWTCPAGAAGVLAAALVQAHAVLDDPVGEAALRERVSAYAAEAFSEAGALARWDELINRVTATTAVGVA